MTLIEVFYGVVFNPIETFNYISRERPLKTSLKVFVIALLSNLVIGLGTTIISGNKIILSLSMPNLIMIVFLGFLFSILMLLLGAVFFPL